MKYLQTFEDRYQYMKNPDDIIKIKSLVEDFIKDKNILVQINELTFDFFRKYNFYYDEIWEELFVYYGNEKTRPVSIYEFIDSFIRSSEWSFKGSKPEIRNSLFKIQHELFYKYNIEDKLDKKLVELLEEKPEKYEERFDYYSEYFNDYVKDKCKWMLGYRKYNL